MPPAVGQTNGLVMATGRACDAVLWTLEERRVADCCGLQALRRRRRMFDQARCQRCGNGPASLVRTKLGNNSRNVKLDRAVADEERLTDGAVGLTGDEES